MKFNQRDKRVLGGCVGTGRLGTKGKEEEESAGSSTSQNRALSRHCPPPVVQVLNALPSLKGTTGPARVINIRASGVYIYIYVYTRWNNFQPHLCNERLAAPPILSTARKENEKRSERRSYARSVCTAELEPAYWNGNRPCSGGPL